MLQSKKRLSPKFLVPLILVLFFLSLLSGRWHRSFWYEQWASNLVSPFTSFFSWFRKGGANFWNHYVALIDISKEMEGLKKEMLSLEQKQNRFQELLLENERLSKMLQLKNISWPEGVAARVKAFDPRVEFKTLRIDKGSRAGIEPDMAVIALGGLVGKVGPVYKEEAVVLLIVDAQSHVDVMVQRSRVRGFLVGTLSGARLEFIKRLSDVQPGDALITSGLDRLFPKGIVVGKILNINENSHDLFLKVKVSPSVDLDQLEEVLVLGKVASL